jgi:Spy/CpxP family protein refolding chaperone
MFQKTGVTPSVTARTLPSAPLNRASRFAAVALTALTLALGVDVDRSFAQGVSGTPPTGAGATSRGNASTRVIGWEWWNDVEVQKALALAPEKSRTIHEIFTRRSEALRPMGDEFMRALTELDRMTRARVVDEATYQLQVVRVEALRAELNKSRTVMLYRLTRELTPEQFKKLEDIRAQRFAGRGRGGAAR